MPQFRQYDTSGQKTPEEALATPIGQALQSLPALWMAHKLEREKMNMQMAELQLKRRQLEAEHGKLTAGGEGVASLPGMTPQPGETLSPTAELNMVGSEGYKVLHPPGARPFAVPNPPKPEKIEETPQQKAAREALENAQEVQDKYGTVPMATAQSVVSHGKTMGWTVTVTPEMTTPWIGKPKPTGKATFVVTKPGDAESTTPPQGSVPSPAAADPIGDYLKNHNAKDTPANRKWAAGKI